MEKNDVKAIKTDSYIPDVVILANGQYPTDKYAISILKSAKYVVCCDGATDKYLSDTNELPDLAIGDGDSLKSKTIKQLGEKFIRVSEQENNDLTKAVLVVKEKGYRSICILGATGYREDHTIANISLLSDYTELGLEVRMITDYGVFIPFIGNAEIMAGIGTNISVFNFGATQIESKGLKYPLYNFTRLWQGTLNKSVEEKISIYSDGMLVVYLQHR